MPLIALVALACWAPTAASAAEADAERYIVVLEGSAEQPGEVSRTHSRRYDVGVRRVFTHALDGYAARIPDDELAAVRRNPRVDYVERDGTVEPADQTLPWGIDRIDADESSTEAGDGDGRVGGVNAYVIDTGIDRDHRDLRVADHETVISGTNNDCDGHGTHVAGTVAAKDNGRDVVGAAPGASLTGVKVIGCGGTGSSSALIDGVDWVTANAEGPSIANISLKSGANQALDDAVKESADSGVFYSVSANNGGGNACNGSPARAGLHPGVMTTAATDENNREASWSNFGPCVDIWAPGANIVSTELGGGKERRSGTSMATPHVGGTAALFLSSQPGASAAAVEQAIAARARTPGTLSKDGRPVRLDYAGAF